MFHFARAGFEPSGVMRFRRTVPVSTASGSSEFSAGGYRWGRGSNPARTNLRVVASVNRGRVEIWRSDTEVFCFQIPLIKPDVRISRIRLSDKLTSVRPRQVSAENLESG